MQEQTLAKERQKYIAEATAVAERGDFPADGGLRLAIRNTSFLTGRVFLKKLANKKRYRNSRCRQVTPRNNMSSI